MYDPEGNSITAQFKRRILVMIAVTSVACHAGQVGPEEPPAAEPLGDYSPGPKPPKGWGVAENFDDGVLASQVTVWNTFPSGQPPAIVEDSTALGGRSLRMAWTAGSTNYRGARVSLPVSSQPMVRVRFRYKINSEASLSGHMQLIQFLGPGDVQVGSLNIAGGQWIYHAADLTGGSNHPASGSTPADCLAQWCWVEASLDYSAGMEVRAKVLINGIMVLDYTRADISHGVAAVQVWGTFSTPADTRNEWIDELTVGSTDQTIPVEGGAPEVFFAADFTDCRPKARVGKLLTPSTGKKGDLVAVTRTNPYPLGQCSAEFTFGGDDSPNDDAWAEWRFQLTRPVSEVWVGWSAWYPGPGDVGKGTAVYAHRAVSPNNNKLLRLWDEDYSRYHLKLGFSHTAATLSNIISEYGTNGTGVGRFGTQPARNAITSGNLGRWIRFVAHMKTATAANNDGVIELWQDGVQTIRNTDLPIYPDGGVGNYFRNGYLLGWANSGFAATTKVWVANVVIAGTRALTDLP